MLCSLHIENVAIINELEVEFGPGFNVITGETGAGKTILLQALSLILGDRASTDLIRSGCEKASVTAVFSLDDSNTGFKKYFEELGIEGGELIIHRIVSLDGKGKSLVNGVPVTQQILKRVSEQLVDISSQHEHQLLLDPATHVEILDRFGSHEERLVSYRSAHEKYIQLKNDLDKMKDENKDINERLDFIRYQLKELEDARLKPGEDEDLELERSRIKNAVQLESKLREVQASLYESAGSVVELLGRIKDGIVSLVLFDPKLNVWLEGVDRAGSEVDDLSRLVGKYLDNLSSDPTRLEEIEDRLYLIKDLKKKYGGSIEACVKKLVELKGQVDKIDNWDELIAAKEKEVREAAHERNLLAARLSKERLSTTQKLSKVIESEAGSLGFKKLRFLVDFQKLPEDRWDGNGREEIQFLISPNVGEEPRSLSKIVSGGELSRIMLAIKRALSDKTGVSSTSIFDEVDSGIGGAIAEVVGKKLLEVSKKRQVICITHLPQIASFGSDHFVVNKKIAGGRTEVIIGRKIGVERREELARMLGGERITETTRAHASEMLKNSGKVLL